MALNEVRFLDQRAAAEATGNWGRVVGIGFGIGTQLLFVWTVIQLFWFLRFGGQIRYAGWWWFDGLLAVGFAIPHSALLTPAAQRRLKHWMPSELFGCLYCCVTCCCLLILIGNWGKSDWTLWQATGWTMLLCQVGFYASWAGLAVSLYWIGFGYQTGLTPWWYWYRRQQAPRRTMVTTGPYHYMRHPVYLSFLGLIWFTPTMSLDHVILTAIWTVYIFVGSYLKDRRLLFYLGDEYRGYAERVVGIPLLGIGSLRRFRWRAETLG